MDLYEVLEVAPDASGAEIKQAFRDRAWALHPDRRPDARDDFLAVKSAYEVLSNPARRDGYDRRRNRVDWDRARLDCAESARRVRDKRSLRAFRRFYAAFAHASAVANTVPADDGRNLNQYLAVVTRRRLDQLLRSQLRRRLRRPSPDTVLALVRVRASLALTSSLDRDAVRRCRGSLRPVHLGAVEWFDEYGGLGTLRSDWGEVWLRREDVPGVLAPRPDARFTYVPEGREGRTWATELFAHGQLQRSELGDRTDADVVGRMLDEVSKYGALA